MGAKGSRVATLQDVIEADPEVASHFKRHFARLNVKGYISASQFNTLLQSYHADFPVKLATRFFRVFDADGDNKLSEEDFVTGMCVLTNGSDDMKIRFAFAVYDASRVGRIDIEEIKFYAGLLRLVDANGWKRFLVASRKLKLSSYTKATFEDFAKLCNHPPTSFVYTWLNKFSCKVQNAAPSEDQSAPTNTAAVGDEWVKSRTPLSKETHFTSEEVYQLEYVLAKVAGVNPTEPIRTSSLSKVLQEKPLLQQNARLPHILVEKFSRAFDPDGDNVISVREYIVALSYLCRGSLEQQLAVLFRIYDDNHDGVISTKEMIELYESVQEVCYSETYDEADNPNELDAVELRRSLAKTHEVDIGVNINDLADDHHVTVRQFIKVARDKQDIKQFIKTLRLFAITRLGVMPIDAKDEALIVNLCMEDTELHEGWLYYVVSKSWWDQWTAYAIDKTEGGGGSGPVKPGKIHNADILDDSSTPDHPVLRQGLVKNTDYVLLPEPAWTALSNWYGAVETIARRATMNDNDVMEPELYPARFTCNLRTTKGKAISVLFSKNGSIKDFKELLSSVINVPASQIRCWSMDAADDPVLLEPSHHTLAKAGLTEQSMIVIELRLKDGSWARQSVDGRTLSSSPKASKKTPKLQRSSSLRRDPTPQQLQTREQPLIIPKEGLVGMKNLGNTCFLSSSLQCMSHTWPLTQYFLLDYYTRELNMTNKAAKNGTIAIVYGWMLKSLWLGEARSSFAPKQLKWLVGKIDPVFQGNQQQDAEEVLRFIINELHESLNRVQEKSEAERLQAEQNRKRREEMDKRRKVWEQERKEHGSQLIEDKVSSSPNAVSEEVVEDDPKVLAQKLVAAARDHWVQFLKSNNSVIIDLFYYQTKSTLKCQGKNPSNDKPCTWSSSTFSPNSILPLPLSGASESNYVFVSVTLVQLEPRPLLRPKPEAQSRSRRKLVRKGGSHKRSRSVGAGLPERHRRISQLVKTAKEMPVHRVKYSVRVSRHGTLRSVLKEVGRFTNIHPKHLVMTDVFHSNIVKFITTMNTPVSELVKPENNLFLFEMPTTRVPANFFSQKLLAKAVAENKDMNKRVAILPRITKPIKPDEKYHVVKLVHRSIVTDRNYLLKATKSKLFGTPICIEIPPRTTIGQLFDTIWYKVSAFVSSDYKPEEHKQPFKLSVVNSDCNSCLHCNWLQGCFGCELGTSRTNTTPPKSAVHLMSAAQAVPDKPNAGSKKPSRGGRPKFSLQDSDEEEEEPADEVVKAKPSVSEVEPAGANRSNIIGPPSITANHGEGVRFANYEINLSKVKSLAIDWDPHFMAEYFDMLAFTSTAEHSSVRVHRDFVEKPLDFRSCLETFMKAERIDEYKCGKCQVNQPFLKQLTLWTCPRILVVQLKRFQWDGSKLLDYVDFPLELDLAQYVHSPHAQYKLYAVVNHIGQAGAGHYICYIKTADKQWYCFDDENIREMDEEHVKTSSAYILFYQRTDILQPPSKDEPDIKQTPIVQKVQGHLTPSESAWMNMEGWSISKEAKELLKTYPGSDQHLEVLDRIRQSQPKSADCIIS